MRSGRSPQILLKVGLQRVSQLRKGLARRVGVALDGECLPGGGEQPVQPSVLRNDLGLQVLWRAHQLQLLVNDLMLALVDRVLEEMEHSETHRTRNGAGAVPTARAAGCLPSLKDEVMHRSCRLLGPRPLPPTTEATTSGAPCTRRLRQLWRIATLLNQSLIPDMRDSGAIPLSTGADRTRAAGYTFVNPPVSFSIQRMHL